MVPKNMITIILDIHKMVYLIKQQKKYKFIKLWNQVINKLYISYYKLHFYRNNARTFKLNILQENVAALERKKTLIYF